MNVVCIKTLNLFEPRNQSFNLIILDYSKLKLFLMRIKLGPYKLSQVLDRLMTFKPELMLYTLLRTIKWHPVKLFLH
jgi:hypothetical protein